MKWKVWGGILIFYWLISILPASAQESECLEIWNYWSDYTRHEVNLNTGRVTTYDSPHPGGAVHPDDQPSPNRHYRFSKQKNELILTDEQTGISATLSRDVRGIAYWSEDSQWLAYTEKKEAAPLMLTVYHVETVEFLSVPLTTSPEAYLLDAAWSPDGRQIALSYAPSSAAPHPDFPIQLVVYSVPELVITQNYEITTWSLTTLVWSPSGRYLGLTGTAQEVGIVDTITQEFRTITLNDTSAIHPQWSPFETYLVIHFTQSDFFDTYIFMDVQGNIILENLAVEGLVGWVNEHEILADLWTETGFGELALVNLQTGEKRLILPKGDLYALSSDRRYLAMQGFDADSQQAIQFFDLTQPDLSPVFQLKPDAAYQNFIWRKDHSELIVFFKDRSLRGYNYETGEWHMIATIPGDEWGIEHVSCLYS